MAIATSVQNTWGKFGSKKMDLEIEIRDYLEDFIDKHKNNPLHLLDVSAHLSEMQIFMERLEEEVNINEQEKSKEKTGNSKKIK